MTFPNTRPNPYVGPRAFRTGEALYGRDREVRQLLDLLIAERIVLLHSPSGAGKTSLIRAGLLPQLQAAGFQVLPIMRVNQDLPKDVAPDQANRYVLSALLSLEAEAATQEALSHSQLASISLAAYLDQRGAQLAEGEGKSLEGFAYREGAAQDEVLIFDQFEEILTAAPTDQQGKQAFFEQLGEALRPRQRWALFAMREDYTAALAPYLRPLPTRLHNTFRLDLLDVNAARQAIQQPVRQQGVTFTDRAAARLVDDLRVVAEQQADGSVVSRLGPYVEPVQMQVVCYRLWNNLDADDIEINTDDLKAVGNVDQSLAEYYAERTALAAAQSGVPERTIRSWFQEQLITEQGIRSQVIMGTESSGGLENSVIDLLRNAFLVRAEKRRGVTWFELAHDRLVGPVRQDNEAWFEANLSLLQRQAALWQADSRPPRLLLRGDDLQTAVGWAAANPQELNENDREFLEASQQAAAEEERARAEQAFRLETAQKLAEAEKLRAEEQSKSARRLRRALVAALLFMGLFLVVAGVAFYLNTQVNQQNEQLQEELSKANSSQLAAQSNALLLSYPQRALLLAAEAVEVPSSYSFPEPASVRQSIYDALANAGGEVLRGHNTELRTTAISSDGCLLATGGLSEAESEPALIIWNLCAEDPGTTGQALLAGATINTLSFAPEGRWLAAGDDNGGVYLWDLAADDSGAGRIDLEGHGEAIDTLVFSPSGRWLATGGRDNLAILWDLSRLAEAAAAQKLAPAQVLEHAGDISSLAFSPDEGWLATGSTRAEIILWNLNEPDVAVSGIPLPAGEGQVLALAFSPDGHWLAAGGNAGGRRPRPIELYDLTSDLDEVESVQLNGHTSEVRALAFHPGGNWLASGGLDDTARLWDLNQLQPVPISILLRGHEGGVLDLGYSQDENQRYIITISTDRTARLWDLNAQDPGADPIVLRGHEGSLRDLAVSARGDLLATVSTDTMARVWDISRPSSATVPFVVDGPTNDVREVAISSDNRWLFSAERNGGVRVWDLSSGYPEAVGEMLVDPAGDDIRLLALAPDGQWLFGAGGSGNVLAWQLGDAGPEPNAIILPGPGGRLTSLAVSQNEEVLVAGGRSEQVIVWDLTQPDPAGSAMLLPGHQGDVTLLALSPYAEWLATAGDDGRLQLYNLNADDVHGSQQELLSNLTPLAALAFSPNGRWLAAAGGPLEGSQENCADCNVHVWEFTETGPTDSPLDLEGHTAQVSALVFNQAENQLGSGDMSGEVRLWKFDRVADPYLSIQVHNREINDLAFTTDGRWLISGGADNILRMWDTNSPNPAANAVQLPGPLKIWSLAVSEDGRWLVAGASNGLLRLWPLDFERLINLACQTAGRNLEPIELQQYLGESPLYKDATCPQWPMNLPATPEP